MPVRPSHQEPLLTRSRSGPETPFATLESTPGPGQVTEEDLYSEDHNEIFEDADNISRPSTPYPTPPDLELASSPTPSEFEESLQPHSRSPSPSPSLSSDDSDDYFQLPHQRLLHHQSIMSTSSLAGEATITGVQRAKDCPVLTAGKVTPQVMLSWRRHCERYKLLNGLADDVVVRHVGGSVQEHHLQDWFAAESARLIPLGLENYLKEFAKHVLTRNWAHRVQEQILSSRQGEKEFSKWRYEIQNLNSVLSMSDTIAPLTTQALRAQLTANLSSDLRLYIANETFADDMEFSDWAIEVTELDDKLRAEKARNARQARNAFNEWSAAAGKSGNTSKKTLAERLDTPTSNTTSSTSRKFLPRLTDADKELLDAHAGCRRCRKFYAGHTTDDCPMKATNTWPEVSTYVPLTAALAAAAKAARVSAGLVAAAVGDEDSELHDAYIEEYSDNEEAPRDDDTDRYSD